MVTVKIENDYSDGHTSTREVTVGSPTPTESLDEWFENVVYEHTGDGHGGDACYTATILAAGDKQLVGKTHEWIG